MYFLPTLTLGVYAVLPTYVPFCRLVKPASSGRTRLRKQRWRNSSWPRIRPFRGLRLLWGYTRVIWGSPKLGVPFLEVPIIRTIVFWGLYWDPSFLGNYHIGIMEKNMGTTIQGIGFWVVGL